MTKIIINQYSASGSGGPRINERPICKTVGVTDKIGPKFREVGITSRRANCIEVYNGSASVSVLVAVSHDSDQYVPVGPLSGRYIFCEGDTPIWMKTIGVK